MTARNLDFILRSIVAPVQAEGARILVLVPVLIGGYFLLSWFHVEPVRVFLYGGGLVVATGAWAWCAAMGWRYMGNCAIGAYLLFIWQSEKLLDVTLPKNPGEVVTANVPVEVNVRRSGDFLIGNVRNLSDRQLQYATVQCWGTYRNGKRAEEPWTVGVGDSGWTMPGQSTQERRLFNLHHKQPERYDLDRTVCGVSQATLRDMPDALPSFTFGEDAESGHTHFTVTNVGAAPIKHVRFSCLHADHGIPVTEQPEPIYQKDPAYVLKPGESIELRSKNQFPDLKDCRVYSVDPAEEA